MAIRIGTAAWAIPRASAGNFPETGTTLERYASVLNAVEINSTFYRPHRRATFERWAASVPATFSFSVKVPKSISHEARLRDCDALLAAFLGDVQSLGPKLGPLLLQLPPSLVFDPDLVEPVCRILNTAASVGVVCEPRHASWFTPDVDKWLTEHRIARVAADPVRGPKGGEPGGWPDLVYYRLHGSPKIYYSQYAVEELTSRADQIRHSSAAETWCILDNTALGAATTDALLLNKMIAG